MKHLDELDHQILQILKEDSRIATRQIAETLQISEATIHHRVKKLKALDVIKKFTISIPLERLGFNVGALLQIRIGGHIIEELNKARTQAIGKFFAYHKQICFLAIGENEFSLYGLIFMKDEEELDLIASEIAQIPDIIEFDIVPFVHILKVSDYYGVNLL